jgi:hypothetical protein
VNVDQHAVGPGADQVIKAGFDGFGKRSVAEDGYIAGEDEREKAGPGSSLDEDAVAGKQ